MSSQKESLIRSLISVCEIVIVVDWFWIFSFFAEIYHNNYSSLLYCPFSMIGFGLLFFFPSLSVFDIWIKRSSSPIQRYIKYLMLMPVYAECLITFWHFPNVNAILECFIRILSSSLCKESEQSHRVIYRCFG